jgi:imidazolonepropionase
MSTRPRADLLIVHADSLCRVRDHGAPRRGASQGEMDVVSDGALAVAGERIVAVGTTAEVQAACDAGGATVIDARGATVLPGLVEAHSHPVFAGSRHREYAQRLAGVPMREVVAAGGGIWNSVLRTRAAPDDALRGAAGRAFRRMLADGITTVEAKSGYGLDTEQELRSLRLLDEARQEVAQDVALTFLGQHVVPEGMTADRYTQLICDQMLPAVAEQGLAEWCDVTCEAGYFTPAQCRRVLDRAVQLGMPLRVHTDAWSPSQGWPLAAEMGAISADHLTFTTDEEIRAVGRTDTIAVLVPVAELVYLSPRRANARLLIEQEVPVAIATDYCSSIPVHSLRFAIGEGAAWLGMTPGQCIVGATLNAAYSISRQSDVGSLDPGKLADVLILDCEHPERFVWELGMTPVRTVIKRGRVVV